MSSILLAPLALLYAAGTGLHRRFGFRSSLPNHEALLPLIVVGSLRAGGSGKTPVSLEIARSLSREGLRVGILAYWLGKSGTKLSGMQTLGPDLAEISPEADWRDCSDEAVLLAREKSVRTFVTRNRESAWDYLTGMGGLDVLLSDDGIMDPRLEQRALRLVLRAPGENPGLSDLLPAGPFHLIRTEAGDCRIEGPLTAPPASDPAGFWFSRELVLPAGLDFSKPCFVLCGMGYPGRFIRNLQAAGLTVSGSVNGPNHGVPNPLEVSLWRERHDSIQAVCSEKDWVKLAGRKEFGTVFLVRERIQLGGGVLRKVRDYRQSRATS